VRGKCTVAGECNISELFVELVIGLPRAQTTTTTAAAAAAAASASATLNC
jgi:hypothetical protein